MTILERIESMQLENRSLRAMAVARFMSLDLPSGGASTPMARASTEFSLPSSDSTNSFGKNL